MRLAQQLYEGVDLGEGNVGLITYMRTDSVSLAAEAVREIREVAVKLYGHAEVAEEPRIYKTKSKNAQEAHEAIRPTSAAIAPADVEGKIDGDLYRLYALDLEARRRLADGASGLRHRRGRYARRRRMARSATCCAPTAPRW